MCQRDAARVFISRKHLHQFFQIAVQIEECFFVELLQRVGQHAFKWAGDFFKRLFAFRGACATGNGTRSTPTKHECLQVS